MPHNWTVGKGFAKAPSKARLKQGVKVIGNSIFDYTQQIKRFFHAGMLAIGLAAWPLSIGGTNNGSATRL